MRLQEEELVKIQLQRQQLEQQQKQLQEQQQRMQLQKQQQQKPLTVDMSAAQEIMNKPQAEIVKIPVQVVQNGHHPPPPMPPTTPQSRGHHTLPLRRPPTQPLEMGSARRVTQTPPPIRTAPAVEAVRRSAATPPPLRTNAAAAPVKQQQQQNAFFPDTFGAGLRSKLSVLTGLPIWASPLTSTWPRIPLLNKICCIFILKSFTPLPPFQ